MPNPGDFDTEGDFLAACVPQVLEEGTASDQDQAVAICASMWENRAMTEPRMPASIAPLMEAMAQREHEDSYARACDIEVERASVDPEAGTFRAAVFTGGEASDGHILNMRGGDLSEQRIPLFKQHWADAEEQLGSLTNPRREGDSIVYDAQIELGGTGHKAEARRDVMHMVSVGHVHRLSGRWDSEVQHATRRVNLPKNHPAFIDANDESAGRKRYGLYFDKWRPMEGSIVGLGSDPDAQIRSFRRQQAVLEAFRAFDLSELVDYELSGGRTYPIPLELQAMIEGMTKGESAGDDPREEPQGDESRHVTLNVTPSQRDLFQLLTQALQQESAQRAEGEAAIVRQLLEAPRARHALRTERGRKLFRDTLRRKLGIVLPER